MDALVSLKNASEDFTVEFDVLPPVSLAKPIDPRQREIIAGLGSLDALIQTNQEKIDAINADIDRLTNHADGVDYASAVICGVVTGMLDAFVVGAWNFESAKARSNQKINEKVLAFAKKHGYNGDRLDGAISFLEDKYPLPGDGAYRTHKGETGINEYTHHLDDFCHHPTLIGLVCCIIVQFTGSTIYCSSSSDIVNLPIEVNQHGKFVGKNPVTKLFSGVVNWFLNVAQTIANRKGHFMSDMAGSSTSAKKGSSGMGLPGSFLSTLKELSALPCFKDTGFGENLRRAFQNGIGPGNKQVSLGAFNSLFEGASSKLDMRTEMAIGSELKRQAVPVVINEVLVRGVYFIRRFIAEMKARRELAAINWKAVLPLGNRTVARMMTIASGTFTAIDLADAAIRSAIKSGGFASPAFLSNMVLRVNFPGVGRFALAVVTDTGMGVQRVRRREERIALYNELIALTNAKIFFKQADMWIAAESAGKTIDQAYGMIEATALFFVESMQDINGDLHKIGTYVPAIVKKNAGLLDDLNDTLLWG